jgi:hypothetical protein
MFTRLPSATPLSVGCWSRSQPRCFRFSKFPNWGVRLIVLIVALGLPNRINASLGVWVNAWGSQTNREPRMRFGSARADQSGFTLSRSERLFRLASFFSGAIQRNAQFRTQLAQPSSYPPVKSFNNRLLRSRWQCFHLPTSVAIPRMPISRLVFRTKSLRDWQRLENWRWSRAFRPSVSRVHPMTCRLSRSSLGCECSARQCAALRRSSARQCAVSQGWDGHSSLGRHIRS